MSGVAVFAALLSAAPLGAVENSVVFVSRDLTLDFAGRMPGLVTKANSGKLMLLPANSSSASPVFQPGPGTPSDVMDPDVSFDATRIVFAGFSDSEQAWRIFEVGADGSGLRQVTRSDRNIDLGVYGPAASQFQTYDDLDPCYLPDGRICFVSTRHPGIAPDTRMRSTNLYVVDADGTDMHRITSERFGADTPAIDPSTGQIVYSRWWRTGQFNLDPSVDPNPIPPGSPGYGDTGGSNGGGQDNDGDGKPDETGVVPEVLRSVSASEFPGVNNWFLASVNPDGTGMAMMSGFRLDREQTQAYRPSFGADGSVIALFIPQTPIIGSLPLNGLRRFHKGASKPEALGGPQTFSLGIAGMDPRGQVPFPVPGIPVSFVYEGASVLPSGSFIVSGAAPSPVFDFDLYVQSGNGAPTIVLRTQGTAELDPVPLVARSAPAIADRVPHMSEQPAPPTREEAYARGKFTFEVENIFFNAPVDVPIATAPPIGKGLSIEFFMAPQRTQFENADEPISLGTQTIGPDGKIKFELPPGVPLFEMLRRPDGTIPIGRDGQIFHVGGMNFNIAGETGKCVGCHAGHSMMQVPEDASWTNLAPSAVVKASSSREGPRFQPQMLVDRRTDPGIAEWAAGTLQADNWVKLSWTVPIYAREIVVYAPRIGTRGNQQVNAFTLAATLNGSPVGNPIETRVTVALTGTRVAWDPSLEFDGLTLTVKREDITGIFDGSPSLALAEIEVISKASPLGVPGAFFLRGDTDCSGNVNITDAITILNNLFLSGEPFCCGTAADTNDDLILNLTDAVILLDQQFRGGDPLPHPFPLCGTSPVNGFVCEDVTTCSN